MFGKNIPDKKLYFIGAVIDAASSFIGGLQKNKQIDKQIAAQREENQKNREWNLNLAKQQNQWNIEQWNRENAYNTPAAQMARYKAAGLNSDLIYGQQNLSAASPEMTAGDGSQPTDVSNLANKATIGDMVSQAAATRLTNAQAKLAESQANKVDEEAEGQGYQNEILKSDAKFRDALNSGTVKLNNISFKVSEKGMQLTDEQITKLRKECAQIDQSIEQSRAYVDEIRQKISNLKTDQAIARLRYVMDAKLNEATLKKIAADTNLSIFELKRLKNLLPYELANIKADTANKNASAVLTSRNTPDADSASRLLDAIISGKELENERLDLSLRPERKYHGQIEGDSNKELVFYGIEMLLKHVAGAPLSQIK